MSQLWYGEIFYEHANGFSQSPRQVKIKLENEISCQITLTSAIVEGTSSRKSF